MKSKEKKPVRSKKFKEKSVQQTETNESEMISVKSTMSKTSMDEDGAEKNERSDIEAELSVGKTEKIYLEGGGTIEIDKKRYTIDRPIKGDYGVVGLMEKGNKKALFALHYEAGNSTIKRLQVEIDVLKDSTKVKKLAHIIPLLSQGKNSKINIHYFTTKMFGETIKELKERFGVFSISTSLKLSYLAIECIEELHKIGFVHRDIKPSVFAIGLEAEGSHLFLLGLGLARRYKSASKIKVKKRSKVPRMGNIHYMSRCCHKRLERSRKDDVESWLYMIVEFFLTSSMPWEGETNHEKVLKRKETFMTSGFQTIMKKCKGLPSGASTIVRQLNTFQYETVPDYHLIKNIFRNAIVQGAFKSEKLDWLKGREYDLLPAGACESRIFGEKTEKTEQEGEESRSSKRPVKEVEEEYVMKTNDSREPRSVFMMPACNRFAASDGGAEEVKSAYYTPAIKANESAYMTPKKFKKISKTKKKN